MSKEFEADITKKYRGELKKLHGNGKSSRRNPYLDKDLTTMLEQLKKVILNHPERFAMRWSIGLERYIHTLRESKKDPNNSKKLTPSVRRGHIVETELFGHFNSELTFLHPALVLYDGGDRVLIAPISTGYYNSTHRLHISIGPKEGMAHNCGISLADVYMVNKNRILYVHSKDDEYIKLPDYILNRVDKIILEYFLPTYSKNNQEKIENLVEENKRLHAEIEKLKQSQHVLQKLEN